MKKVDSILNSSEFQNRCCFN